MASTSASPAHTEGDQTATTSQGMASSSSSSSSRSLFSCCLDWVSVFPSWRTSMESDSVASNPESEGFQEATPSVSTSDTSGCMTQDEAFQEMAPSASSMVISSTLIQKPSYDVFINHRGPDVKKTLAPRIYDVLVDMKVTTFLDSKELEYGDFFPTALETTIRAATLHIAIFSETYAESAWCLEELSLMLKSGAKIIPIFYHVDPTDLRHAAQSKRKFAAALKKHEQKGRYKPEKLKDWKDALYKVSFYKGEIIQKNDDEMRVLKNIVNIVLKQINNVPLEVAKHPVSLNEIVKDFEKTIQLADGDQGVQIVGIWGMGGSGKTTLAKELYNKKSSFMEKSSFIFDIRDAKDVLYKKQIQLLKDFGVIETFDSVNQGKAIIRRNLRSFKVLIVMDDVDHVNQLDALLPTIGNLGRGSLIIVTTREYQILTSWGISSVYKMKGLDQFYAKQLFCWHAFLKPYPLNDFEELVKNFVDACNGLPLSLKVFGALLYGNLSKQSWKSVFHKISRILPEDIKERLKISYDSLEHEEKEAFLDCACFFIKRKSNVAIEVWDGSGWSGLYAWETLLNKCLVELDNDNCIRMHDHLRDLGRAIAKDHSPSRLWSSQQIINYDKQKESVKGIRGIKITLSEKEEQFSYTEALIPCLAEPKLLVIKGGYFNQIISQGSIGPLWLSWSNIRQRNLPPRLSLKNLRVLEISGEPGKCHFEKLWEAQSDAPLQLRELVISFCFEFQRLPNSIGCLSELKKIVIGWSHNIRSLPESFCRLQQLEHLQLAACNRLSSLPCRFGDLTNLRYLDLSRCSDLKNLPVSFRNLSLLQHLNLAGCRELILEPDDFQNITKLEFLSLDGCSRLEGLPRHITNQASLRELNLSDVERLREVPIEIGELGRLQELSIGSGLLISLPNSLGRLSLLTHLTIGPCPELESLPTSLGALSSLTRLRLRRCAKLESLPSSLGGLSSLTYLGITICPKLESLPSSLGDLSSLTDLTIFECPKLESLSSCLGRLSSLRSLSIEGCPNLESLPTSLGALSSLTRLRLDSCAILESLPSSLGVLSALTYLSISSCPKLESLPSCLGRLSSLTHLAIESCPKIRCLLFSVQCLPLLEYLHIYKCPIEDLDFGTASLSFPSSNLKQVTLWKTEVSRISIAEESYPRLESLNLLENDHLREIKALPVSLKCLDICRHPELVVLPSFARLTSLRELRVRECGTIEKIDGLKDCTELEKLSVETSGEVLGIETLEQMQNMMTLELRANKASAIVSCIQTIKKWPDQITVCTRAVPDAASLLLDSSILSSNAFLVDSLRFKMNDSSKSPFSEEMKALLNNSSMSRNAMMLCFVINSAHSSPVQIQLREASSVARITSIFVSEGRWAVIGIFTPRCAWLTTSLNICLSAGESNYYGWSAVQDVELERSLAVGGEEQRLVEAFLPLLQSISN